MSQSQSVTRSVCAGVSPELYAEIEQQAKAERRSVRQYLGLLIADAIDRKLSVSS